MVFLVILGPEKMVTKINNSLQELSRRLGIQKQQKFYPFYLSPEQTPEQKEKLGIENLKLASKEENYLHSLIENIYREKLPSKIEKFDLFYSSPRKYKNLPKRLGIRTSLKCVSPPLKNQEYQEIKNWYLKNILFIFKKVNNKWEIEKIGNYQKERSLIEEIKKGL
jgi:hypothetical protein